MEHNKKRLYICGVGLSITGLATMVTMSFTTPWIIFFAWRQGAEDV